MQRQEIERKAFETYLSGYHCAEVISKTIIEAYGDASTSIPKVASGFGGGVGRTSEDVCGIFSGGIIALGYLHGRMAPEEDIKDVFVLTAEWRKRFITKVGTTQCPAILEKFGEQENMMKYKKLTAEMTAILAELLDKPSD
jgi:C_GCAxxG_C_C family probable redox protein